MRAVNLIPAEQRGGSSVGAGRSGGVAYAVLALFAGIAVLAILYGIASHQVSTRKGQAASLEARAAQAESAAQQLAPYTAFAALRQARTQAVESLVDSRFDWAHAFHEFGRVLPFGASLASLTGTIGKLATTSGGSKSSSSSSPAASVGAVSSVTPPGSIPTFTLTGCAASQDTVAETIDRLRLINGVSTVTLSSATKPGPSGSGAASSGGGSGGCGRAVTYNLQVAFQPLPTTTAAAAAATTRTVSETTTGGSK
ncbi:MAG TPA: hypothetical protein VHT27_08575 [Solirubrobacteraceae bacterium]|jgi:Tfp pilus assembly protein PilN|nr:hypothetical protein [Solirubrobacteraceae bacterium]